MPTLMLAITVVLLLPLAAWAQDGRARLERVSRTLGADQHLPLHGRMVPFGELTKTITKSP